MNYTVAGFLQRFTAHSQGIAFAVLGGAFAEGVDLPGRRLIGAFIATLGLPQINEMNEEIRKRISVWIQKQTPSQAAPAASGAAAGQGYNYTYLYPGIQKVVQAAGRVIRTQGDEGVLYLMDDRFTKAEVQALLPAWWKMRRLHVPVAI